MTCTNTNQVCQILGELARGITGWTRQVNLFYNQIFQTNLPLCTLHLQFIHGPTWNVDGFNIGSTWGQYHQKYHILLPSEPSMGCPTFICYLTEMFLDIMIPQNFIYLTVYGTTVRLHRFHQNSTVGSCGNNRVSVSPKFNLCTMGNTGGYNVGPYIIRLNL